jgi:hypothetical protein
VQYTRQPGLNMPMQMHVRLNTCMQQLLCAPTTLFFKGGPGIGLDRNWRLALTQPSKNSSSFPTATTASPTAAVAASATVQNIANLLLNW